MGSTPTICAKSSTLRGAAFYFCNKLCKGCKVGFEQPLPGALRPAGLQQSCRLLQGRGDSHHLHYIRRRIERFYGGCFGWL